MKKIKRLSAILLALALTVTSFSMPSMPVSAFSSSSATVSYPWRGYVNVSSGTLNVRASASSSGTVVGSAAKGAYVHIIGKSGNWYKIYYTTGGSAGYVSADYITTNSTYVRASDNVNLRASASTTATIKTTVPNGTSVPWIATSGSFYRVVYRTYDGYISTSYALK